jgi:hypothetical protein
MTDATGHVKLFTEDGAPLSASNGLPVNVVAGGTGGGGGTGTKTLTQPSIGTSATLALAANTARREAILLNPATTGAILYLGASGVTTSAYMVALDPGDSYVDDASTDAWYGVSGGSAITINVTQVVSA